MVGKSLTAAQRKNINAYAKCHREIASLSKKLDAVEARRRRVIERVFDEIEKDPSRYTHLIHKGRSRQSVPMTKALARKLKRQMLQQQGQPPNPHGGPGCGDCEDIDGCWCAFRAGPLCCYICLSPAVIQCHF